LRFKTILFNSRKKLKVTTKANNFMLLYNFHISSVIILMMDMMDGTRWLKTGLSELWTGLRGSSASMGVVVAGIEVEV